MNDKTADITVSFMRPEDTSVAIQIACEKDNTINNMLTKYTQISKDTQKHVGAYINNELVGFMYIFSNFENGIAVSTPYIYPQYRRKNISENVKLALMQFIDSLADENNYETVRIENYEHDNKINLNIPKSQCNVELYRKAGYDVIITGDTIRAIVKSYLPRPKRITPVNPNITAKFIEEHELDKVRTMIITHRAPFGIIPHINNTFKSKSVKWFGVYYKISQTNHKLIGLCKIMIDRRTKQISISRIYVIPDMLSTNAVSILVYNAVNQFNIPEYSDYIACITTENYYNTNTDMPTLNIFAYLGFIDLGKDTDYMIMPVMNDMNTSAPPVQNNKTPDIGEFAVCIDEMTQSDVSEYIIQILEKFGAKNAYKANCRIMQHKYAELMDKRLLVIKGLALIKYKSNTNLLLIFENYDTAFNLCDPYGNICLAIDINDDILKEDPIVNIKIKYCKFESPCPCPDNTASKIFLSELSDTPERTENNLTYTAVISDKNDLKNVFNHISPNYVPDNEETLDSLDGLTIDSLYPIDSHKNKKEFRWGNHIDACGKLFYYTASWNENKHEFVFARKYITQQTKPSYNYIKNTKFTEEQEKLIINKIIKIFMS